MNEINERLREFVRERNWEHLHTPRNLVLALTGEVGELAEACQWKTDEQIKEDISKMQEEIADVVIYAMRLADILGIDIKEAIHKKIDRNIQKYPAEIVKGSSKKYNEYPISFNLLQTHNDTKSNPNINGDCFPESALNYEKQSKLTEG